MPSRNFFEFRRFRLEIDGVAQGAFDALDGSGNADRLASSGSEAGLSDPNRTQARLLRGLANTRELFGWFQEVLDGEPQPRRAEVVELGDDGEERVRHLLEDAWPVRIKVATLTSETLFDVEELALRVTSWKTRTSLDAAAEADRAAEQERESELPIADPEPVSQREAGLAFDSDTANSPDEGTAAQELVEKPDGLWGVNGASACGDVRARSNSRLVSLAPGLRCLDFPSAP